MVTKNDFSNFYFVEYFKIGFLTLKMQFLILLATFIFFISDLFKWIRLRLF